MPWSIEDVDALARDTVNAAAMGKRGLQAIDALGVADLDPAFLGHNIKPRPNIKVGESLTE